MSFICIEVIFTEKVLQFGLILKVRLSVEHGNDVLVYKANRCLNCDADEFLEWAKATCL